MAMTIEQEREAFEKWMSEAHPSYPLTSHEGRYVLTSVRNLWAAFSSGCAHITQPAQAVDVERVAQLIAHRACCGTEADPLNGKLHGYCVVCGVPWPCEYAGTPPTRALSGEKAGPVGDGVVRVQVRSPITGKYVWMNALLPASPTPDKEGA